MAIRMATLEHALTALADIEAALGPSAVRYGQAVGALDPGWNAENLDAGLMAMPTSTAEVVEIVKICAGLEVSLVPQGGRTGLVGGSVSRPGEIVLSLERMNRIERVDPCERVAVVEAGVTLYDLQAAAAPFGLEPAIDLAARGSATLGGMASTNAGGIMAFRYGVMRHQILGLEAVLPGGGVYSDMTRVVKTAAGYDLKHLMIGSEGTLGIVTRLALKLEPKPLSTTTALIALPSIAAALAAVDLALRLGSLRAAEVLWRAFLQINAAGQGFHDPALDDLHPLYLLLAFGGRDQVALRESVEALYVELAARFPDISGIIAESEKQARDLWRLREDTHTIYRAFPAAPSYDVSVPLSQIETYAHRVERGAKELGLTPYIFGHLADGNLHVVFGHAGAFPRALAALVDELLYDGIAALGGAFSAEHGVGSKRIASLYATIDSGKVSLMRALKQMIDPQTLFNPGKVLGPP